MTTEIVNKITKVLYPKIESWIEARKEIDYLGVIIEKKIKEQLNESDKELLKKFPSTIKLLNEINVLDLIDFLDLDYSLKVRRYSSCCGMNVNIVFKDTIPAIINDECMSGFFKSPEIQKRLLDINNNIREFGEKAIEIENILSSPSTTIDRLKKYCPTLFDLVKDEIS